MIINFYGIFIELVDNFEDFKKNLNDVRLV